MMCGRIRVRVAGRAFVLVDLAVPPGESLVACARVVLVGIEAAPADSTRIGGTVVVVEAQGVSVRWQGLAFGVSARGCAWRAVVFAAPGPVVAAPGVVTVTAPALVPVPLPGGPIAIVDEMVHSYTFIFQMHPCVMTSRCTCTVTYYDLCAVAR